MQALQWQRLSEATESFSGVAILMCTSVITNYNIQYIFMQQGRAMHSSKLADILPSTE